MKQDKSGKLSDYSWTTDLIWAVKYCRLRPLLFRECWSSLNSFSRFCSMDGCLTDITKPATQNILKYTQAYWEIEVLTDTSYCFNVYALAIEAIRYSQVLVHSTVVNSRNSLRYILTFAWLCNFVCYSISKV